MNRKPRLGLVGVASHDESGGQRADSFLAEAKEAMEKAGHRRLHRPDHGLDAC